MCNWGGHGIEVRGYGEGSVKVYSRRGDRTPPVAKKLNVNTNGKTK